MNNFPNQEVDKKAAADKAAADKAAEKETERTAAVEVKEVKE